MDILRQQYQLVRDRRSVLFDYCDTILPKHFTEDLQGFGNKSIRSLLVHVPNAYRFWIAHFAGTGTDPFVKSTAITDVKQVRIQFSQVDDLMERFFSAHENQLTNPITARVPGKDIQLTVTPLELATHVMTHEFHHKGQILSMSRYLGYVPIDTDLIRF